MDPNDEIELVELDSHDYRRNDDGQNDARNDGAFYCIERIHRTSLEFEPNTMKGLAPTLRNQKNRGEMEPVQ
jgi:hypothetical protein